jgi:hypothetical protein
LLNSLLKPLGYKLIRRPRPRAVPSLVVVTTPKSGSMFLAHTLARTLKLERIDISPGYFPIDHADLKAMTELAMGGYIAQAHLSACQINLNILSRYCDKWVVHFRDPRAALLSWTHHKDRPNIKDDPKMDLRTVPLEPAAYHSSMSFTEKLDWQIDHHLPNLIQWMEGWCQVIDNPEYKDRIVVSNYENIVGRDEMFIRSLLDSLGRQGPPSIELAAKDRRSHYRKGEVDEWRAALTPEQAERATNAIPKHLMNRFDWKQ